MKIAVIGGGNIGMLMAAEIAHKGHEVFLYTKRAENFSSEIAVYNQEEELVLTGRVSPVSSLRDAVKGARIIYLTYPAHLFPEISAQLLPLLEEGQQLGIIPGSGGAEFYFYSAVLKGVVLFGFHRVHSVARVREAGKSVYMLGRKSSVDVGAIPAGKAAEICAENHAFFNLDFHPVSTYLCVTLVPSNQILHTSRLYSMFCDYSEGRYYDHNFLFYEEWTDHSSEVMIEMDCELQRICTALPFDLSQVIPVTQHYESFTVEEMTRKIRSIKAFRGLTSPMKETERGWVPDFSSRYFIADFAYGLRIVQSIGKLFSVETPVIDRVMTWFLSATHLAEDRVFRLPLGKEEFLAMYRYGEK